MDFRVLVADDNEDHRFLTRRALEVLAEEVAPRGNDPAESGVRILVDMAVDGEDAVARLTGCIDSPETRPDLVLLDLKMPRRDGFGVLEIVKKDPRLAIIPILVLSSSDNDNDVGRAYSLGANAYLVKPMNGALFSSRIRESVRYWVTAVVLPPRK